MNIKQEENKEEQFVIAVDRDVALWLTQAVYSSLTDFLTSQKADPRLRLAIIAEGFELATIKFQGKDVTIRGYEVIDSLRKQLLESYHAQTKRTKEG